MTGTIAPAELQWMLEMTFSDGEVKRLTFRASRVEARKIAEAATGMGPSVFRRVDLYCINREAPYAAV